MNAQIPEQPTPPVLADENIPNRLVYALAVRGFDVVRAIDVGLGGMGDDAVLEWAASKGRVVISLDVRTMGAEADRRRATEKRVPGLIRVTADDATAPEVLEEIEMCLVATDADYLAAQNFWVPLR